MLRVIVIFVLVNLFLSPSFASRLKTEVGPPESGSVVSAKASLALGQRYEHGEGVSRDPARAQELYCEAARAELPAAYFQLGWMYLNGHGVIRNDSVGSFWLRKAAEHGIPQALNLLHLLSSISPAQKSSCAQRLHRDVYAPKEIRELIVTKANAAGIDPKLVMAVISAESGFDSEAISPKRARGLMQLTSDTAKRFGVEDPFNVDQNLHGGISFLAYLMKRFHGDLGLALAAYNAGESAIDEWGGIPPYDETMNYVKRVKSICACSGITAATH